jgi:hypothetical protein
LSKHYVKVERKFSGVRKMGKLVYNRGEISVSNSFLKPFNNLFGIVYITSLAYFFRIIPL